MTNFLFKEAQTPNECERVVANQLFSKGVDFLKGVVDVAGLPAGERVEICFAGRSNVGKSTLVNALCGRKNLARTSNTPGRTQELNFFTLGESHYIVDLPGYGYAKAPPEIVARWQNLLSAYLRGRAGLRRAFVLIDSRHGLKAVDLEMLETLNGAAVPFQIVLTKADKLKPGERETILARCIEGLGPFPAAYLEIIVTSAEKRLGIDTLRATIAGLCD